MTPELPLGAGVRVLAVHPSLPLFAIDKPAGILSHPNRDGAQRNTLLDAPYNLADECYSLPHNSRLHLLNRLDSPTSGVLLATIDNALANEIKKIFKSHCAENITKIYYAVVKGSRFTPPNGIWRDRLTRRNHGGALRTQIGGAGAIPALTRYQCLASTTSPTALSLLRLSPETGRTHQLRVQSAAHFHPIIGDKTYGDFLLNRRLEKLPPSPALSAFNRLFLHAQSISIAFSWKNTPQSFTATSPLPQDFLAIFPTESL
ncbi:MAG: RluA family pseudouridine synthase [Puniceicoccales bacterium]|nr:RluA family pseudouridine synthase [Puniceicoccales bacterium]